jgi:hypothetical protein
VRGAGVACQLGANSLVAVGALVGSGGFRKGSGEACGGGADGSRRNQGRGSVHTRRRSAGERRSGTPLLRSADGTVRMVTAEARMQTFVVRVWVGPPPPTREDEELRGVVEHIGSGGSTTFTDITELVAFLHEASGRQAGQAGDAQ